MPAAPPASPPGRGISRSMPAAAASRVSTPDRAQPEDPSDSEDSADSEDIEGGVSFGAGDPLPGPPSFAETAPLLPEIYRLVAEKKPASRRLAAGFAALEDWMRRPPADPLAAATAEWLRAKLLVALGRRKDALKALDELAKRGGAFGDDARLELADLAPQSGPGAEPEARAEWLVTRSPGATGYLKGIDEAAKIFKRIKKSDRAIALVEASLGQAMSPTLRSSLLVKLSDLYRANGSTDKAISILRSYYWSNRHSPASSLTKALKAMKAAPGDDEDLFRRALHAGRASCRKVVKDMAKVRRPKKTPAWIAAEALSDRWSDATGSLATLDKTTKGKSDLQSAPEVLLARAMLLRRLNRDDEAVTVFGTLIDAHPRHPFAAEARDQAALVLRRLGRFAEADVMDEDLLALAMAGPYHREALWRLGFGAILRKESSIAEKWLAELEVRYGAEPDRHSFTWFERARYWRGRAASLAGKEKIATPLFEGLVARYPAGWYALLARNRLGRGKDNQEAAGVWDVARDDPMATALAWYRLGAEKEALDAFEALMGAYQLPGNGRKLLADLLSIQGSPEKAARVMKFASIPPTMPGDDPAEMYFSWYPMPHSDDVASAAKSQNFPKHLLAGVVSVETRFNATIKSSVGAIGLAQVMPSTGESLGKRLFGDSFKAAQLWDPATNLSIAAKYLGDLLGRFSNHPALAVAAYNAGPTPVKRWLAERGGLELDAFVETIPYEEARRYVMRVLSDAEIYRRLYHLDGLPLKLPLKVGP